MGVYIKGMEMPKENDYTIAIIYGDGVVTEYHEDYWIRGADGEKQLGTAVPVPPHGRLIDADALFDFILNIYKTAQGDKRKAYRDVLDTIVAAGDVIPAEEGE